jgi:hypothetical protein
LGVAAGEPVRNRVTPLFALYSPTEKDYAAVATPQLAMSLAFYHGSAYRSVVQTGDTFLPGAAIPGYAILPNDYFESAASKASKLPRARAMILTTHASPHPAWPAPTPLYLMERPAGNSNGDFLLVSSTADLQNAANTGYRYLGQQGYVYTWCAAGPGCVVPPGSEALHLKCSTNASVKDCAVFLQSQNADFAAKGYTSLFPGSVRSELGFAYPVSDVDADGLVDAMERLIGTSLSALDSDGDGQSDSAEYPLAMAPFSDPCDGPAPNCPRIAGSIFSNGFE